MEIIVTEVRTEFTKINKIVLGMDNSEKNDTLSHGSGGKDLGDQYN